MWEREKYDYRLSRKKSSAQVYEPKLEDLGNSRSWESKDAALQKIEV